MLGRDARVEEHGYARSFSVVNKTLWAGNFKKKRGYSYLVALETVKTVFWQLHDTASGGRPGDGIIVAMCLRGITQ